ncbi:MAG: glycosyltransferase family 39 protein [Taibaiella sp.]|nr:glycosyltransferase family 39 protein [Taibaiella sp.]
MSFIPGNSKSLARTVTLCSLFFLIGFGFVVTLFPLKPFWVDEWRIIYNLKSKDATALWGPLDLMQQFPRTYLQVFKAVTQYFDYSYLSLRLPSLIVGTLTLVFGYRLLKRLFPGQPAHGYLFILILASSHTFVVYFVQVKQYTMDMFMSILCLWQLLELLAVKRHSRLSGTYFLLCFSFIVAPFFSYSYPILVAPVFAIGVLQTVFMSPFGGSKPMFVIRLWLPLLLCLVSLGAFYLLDVAQLMKDNGMKIFWESMMMQDGFRPLQFLRSLYLIFANTGNGALFEIIFGVTGLAAFYFSARESVLHFKRCIEDPPAQVRLYALGLIIIIIVLFVAGKLPIGEPRLICYAVPSIAILIIRLLRYLALHQRTAKFATGLTVVLFLGTVGNIINNPVKSITGKDYRKKFAIYNNVTAAIKKAQEMRIPVFVTSAISFPDIKVISFPLTDVRADILCFPAGYDTLADFIGYDDMPADWVVKTMPAYQLNMRTPVYAVDDISNALLYLSKIPGGYPAAVAVNDTTFRMIRQ